MINRYLNQYAVTFLVCVIAATILTNAMFYIFRKDSLATGLFAASIALGLSLSVLYLLVIHLIDDQSTQNVDNEESLQNDCSIFEGSGPFVLVMILLLLPTLGSLCYIILQGR